MASHNGRVLVVAIMMAVLLGASPSASGQNLPLEFGVDSSEGRFRNSATFSVTLKPSRPSESSTGGVFALIGKGVSAAPASSTIFEDSFESGNTALWSATVPEPTALPSGAVSFFNSSACPTGWSALELARGRTMVGLQPGGSLGGTVFAPLGNLSSGNHVHAWNWSGDVSSKAAHNHWWAYLFASERRWISYSIDGPQQTLFTWGNGMGNEGSGVYPFTHTLEERAFQTNMAGYHDHTLTFDGYLGPGSEVLPYVQLLACVKD